MQITVKYSSGCYSPALSLSDTGSYIHIEESMFMGVRRSGGITPGNFLKINAHFNAFWHILHY